MSTLKLRAVPGRQLPHPAIRNAFVGYRPARASEVADLEIPGGRRYVRLDVEELNTSAYLRRAVARGDVTLVVDDPGDTKPAKAARAEKA